MSFCTQEVNELSRRLQSFENTDTIVPVQTSVLSTERSDLYLLNQEVQELREKLKVCTEGTLPSRGLFLSLKT